MATQITLDFTDAQWELVKAHLRLPDTDNSYVVPTTEAACKAGIERWVKYQVQTSVTEAALRLANTNSQNAFEV